MECKYSFLPFNIIKKRRLASLLLPDEDSNLHWLPIRYRASAILHCKPDQFSVNFRLTSLEKFRHEMLAIFNMVRKYHLEFNYYLNLFNLNFHLETTNIKSKSAFFMK